MSGGVGSGASSTSRQLQRVDQTKSWSLFVQKEGEGEKRGVKRKSDQMVGPIFSVFSHESLLHVDLDVSSDSFYADSWVFFL